ncbi:MAG: hypothetical protein Kow00114_39210 [Kiloniellaceae bacterium]
MNARRRPDTAAFLLHNGKQRRQRAAAGANRRRFQAIAPGAAALQPRKQRRKPQESADIPSAGLLTGPREESQAIGTWPGKTGDDLAAAKPVR